MDVLQNWLNGFYFLFLMRGLLVILIDCMVFLSPFLDVTRMSMSAVSFLAQLNSGIYLTSFNYRIFLRSLAFGKFVQCQSPHLGFRWRYRHILFGYQARIFHFTFLIVSHKSLSLIT